jgi:hypothetical protein
LPHPGHVPLVTAQVLHRRSKSLSAMVIGTNSFFTKPGEVY